MKSISTSFTSAGSLPLKPHSVIVCWWLRLFLLLSMPLLSACGKRLIGSQQEKGDAVDLRSLPPLGFKWTEKGVGNFTFRDGSGGGRETTTVNNEVTAVSDDAVTIKSNQQLTTSYWGNSFQNPDADRSKNRLIIRTVDRCGRVISSEGESADEPEVGSMPDRPIKVGETFTRESSGRGVTAGMDNECKYTLKEVITVKGRRMAVFDISMNGDFSGPATEMYDLQTGLVVRTKYDYTGKNPQGFRMDFEGEAKITDASGEKWLE